VANEPVPAPRPSNEPLDGMTGATGNLVPGDPDDQFVSAARREAEDPDSAGAMTAAAHRRREARRATGDDDPGSLIDWRDDVPPNDRDGGYGSEHGLSSEDPAYREETPLPQPPRPARSREQRRLGADEVHGPEEDRF
jgi:hypothetical protein